MIYLKNVATIQINADQCKGCGQCLNVCPRNVFSMVNGKASIINRDNCIECGACMRNCSFKALHVNSGVGCAQAVFNSFFNGGKVECGCDSNKASGGCC